MSQSLLYCYLLFLILPVFPLKTGVEKKEEKRAWHPLHLSSTDLVYNATTATIEMSCRLFTDDLEDALSKQFKVRADLSAPAKHKAMDELLKKYMALHFRLEANGKALTLNYLGFEQDREATLVYLESVPVKSLKKLNVYNSLMYDLFEDQTNLMHVNHHGMKRSSKLDYPKTDGVIINQ